MRFEDVSDRLAATVRNPGGRGDGAPFNVAVPHMGSVRIYQAVYGGYTWVIAYEPGVPGWSDSEKAAWVGYTASYRKIGQSGSSQTIRIDGGPWRVQAEAERACVAHWQKIRNPS